MKYTFSAVVMDLLLTLKLCIRGQASMNGIIFSTVDGYMRKLRLNCRGSMNFTTSCKKLLTLTTGSRVLLKRNNHFLCY